MPKLKTLLSNRGTGYRPAELKKHKNKDWFIVYAIEDRFGQIKRRRKRVKKITPAKKRLEYAIQIVQELNSKLHLGWNPELNVDDKQFFNDNSIQSYMSKYIKHVEKRYENDELRYDTHRTYKSQGNLFKEWLDKQKKKYTIKELDHLLISKYIEHKKYHEKSTNRYVNNIISFLKTFCSHLVYNEIILSNPMNKISSLKNEPKKREYIPKDVLSTIFDYFKKENYQFYIMCVLTYICFIRRTELTKLKVKHIEIDNSVIRLTADISKNKKNETVTIPNKAKKILKKHIKDAQPNVYVFSDDFKCGTKELKPKKITYTWNKMKSHKKLKKTYQYYSLKDTGITNLFNQGFPTIKIRDQARHSDIKITESYAPKKNEADEKFKNLNF